MATKPAHPFDADTVDPAALKRLGIVNPSEWHQQQPPPREWLLEGWMPWRKATLFTGRGQAGKSLLGQQLCTCAALGLPLLGMPTRKSPALYVTCEDDHDELQRRQRAICETVNVKEAALDGQLWLASWVGQGGTELATFEKVERDEYGGTSDMLQRTRRYNQLRETAVALGAEVIVLDNVAHLFIGNENDRAQVAAFMGLLEDLALTVGCVILIGHPNKAGDQFSGSTAWENQVRSRIYMETPAAEDGIVVDRDARVLRVGKANYAANGAELRFRWHQGAFVRDIDLPPSLAEQIAETAQAGADNDAFLACLAERNRQNRPVSERPSVSFAPKVFATMSESRGIGKARLHAAMDRLFRLGRIERATLGRDKSKGRDIEGLRIVE